MILGRSGLGYVAAWDDGGVEITIDHLRRRGGELHGEITVAAALRGQLHRASFNVSSTTTRDRLAKALAERAAPHDYGWGPRLEEFCASVLAAEQAGAPIVNVGQMAAQPAEAYLIDGFLPAGKATILYGAGGTGKSYLACYAACAVVTGHPYLGLVAQRGRVLYLDWETDSYEVDERLKRVAAGMGLPTPEILYRACAAPLESMAEQLSGLVAREKVALVIVDSVGMASGVAREGGDANESAIRLFTSARHLDTTILAIDHITGEDVKQDRAVAKPYGSVYKVNLARSVWEVRRAGEPEGEESHLGLYHRKVNRGRLQGSIGIKVTHTEASTAFAREEMRDDALLAGLGNTTRILRALASGPLTTRDIAEDTGIGEASVRTTLSRGRERQFVKLGEKWGLAATTLYNVTEPA